MSKEMNAETFRTEARKMVEGARAAARLMMPDDLPDRAETPGQAALEAKHGTPKAFAEAVIRAVGEVSASEAVVAVERYAAEWRVA